jgi:uncharacterized membrane protein YgcG
MNKFIAILAVVFVPALLVPLVAQAITLPPTPTQYFNDFASAVRPETAEHLNQRLVDFERQTSNQIVVAIFHKLPEGVSWICTLRTSSVLGKSVSNNGVIFFVFVQDRKMRIQTDRGLEDALSNIASKRMITDEVAPRFQVGDFDGGLTAGVNAITNATKDAYKGTGHTAAETKGRAQEATVSALHRSHFKLDKLSTRQDKHNVTWVDGEITSNAKKEARTVWITVRWLDKNGHVADHYTTHVADLAPGETRPFSTHFANKGPEAVRYDA